MSALFRSSPASARAFNHSFSLPPSSSGVVRGLIEANTDSSYSVLPYIILALTRSTTSTKARGLKELIGVKLIESHLNELEKFLSWLWLKKKNLWALLRSTEFDKKVGKSHDSDSLTDQGRN